MEMQSRTFDTSTKAGLKQAERYQQSLYAKFDQVVVVPLGLYRVKIWGEHGVDKRRLDGRELAEFRS